MEQCQRRERTTPSNKLQFWVVSTTVAVPIRPETMISVLYRTLLTGHRHKPRSDETGGRLQAGRLAVLVWRFDRVLPPGSSRRVVERFPTGLLERIEDLTGSDKPEPRRITLPGVHAFSPAASHNGKWIAVATRRPGTEFRRINIFDLESSSFIKITETLNPNFHHYNPFFSHRFRGESDSGESTIPHLNPVTSPVRELRMLRLNGSFPSVSPTGDLIAFNHDFDLNPGVQIARSDGSKRWTVMKGRPAFLTVWSPTEPGVIYTSVGPIFQTARSTVQIARISFDLKDLDDRDEIPAEVKILTREDSGNNAFPSCSPDGKLIAFSSNRHDPENVEAFSLYLVRPDGTEVRWVRVAGGDDVDRERINHVCFSPDSSWLLFTANLGGVSAETVSLPNQFQLYGELFVARLDGSGA
ncbi:hypothetical protein AAC387_Pa05g1604 [Persea americana]